MLQVEPEGRAQSNRFLIPREPNDPNVVQFYGRWKIVSQNAEDYLSLIRTLKLFEQRKISNETKWKDFNSIISDFLEHLESPNYQLKQYQIELVRDVIVGYIGGLNRRFHSDEKRVKQIVEIMTTILLSRNDTHPAYCLIRLGEILKDVNSGSYFFTSELSGLLTRALQRQWQPILRDTRTLLVNFGSKLLFFGLLGVVGWPLVLMYPMINHSKRLLQILEEFDRFHRVSSQSIFDLMKIFIMVVVCFQLTSIMATYVTFGYTAAVSGALALGIAQSDRLIKDLSPVIAQYAPHIDRFLRLLDSGDFQQITASFASNRTGQPVDFPHSNQVEELPANNISPSSTPVIEEVSDDEPNPSIQIPTNIGLRQRK